MIFGMTWIVLTVIAAFLVAGGGDDVAIYLGRRRRNKQLERSKAKSRAVSPAPAPEPAVIYSWPSKQVMDAFSKVPQAHRPSYDIQAALKALDFKHDVSVVNNHFMTGDGMRYGYESNTWNCRCHLHNRNVSRPDKCLRFPEYREIHKAMTDIPIALRNQKHAEEQREREIALAGMESDLRSVEDITNALRMERTLIDDVTKEIRP